MPAINQIHCLEAREGLQQFDSESVDCVITSPPYWATRDYGLSPVKWADGPEAVLGLEDDLESYIAHLLEVFDEVKRVLKPTGTFWVNLGDTYAGSWGNYAPGGIKGKQRSRSEHGQRWQRSAYSDTAFRPPSSHLQKAVPKKSLCLIPERFALGMLNRGWLLRNRICWHKPNHMPSSVKDRLTSSWEHFFFFTKSRKYFFDLDAVREAHHVLHGQSRSRETIMEMLLRQCREIGIGILVVDQHPHLLSPAATGNLFASICLNLKDPRDVNRAAALSAVDESDRRHISTLPVGQGVVKLQDRWHQPVLVKFPLLHIAKGAVTDTVLRRYCANQRADSGRKGERFDALGEIPQIPLADDALNVDELAFLEDVLAHEDDGVRARYLRLGLSSGRGNRIKEQLLHRGWLEAQRIEIGNSRKVLLRLSKQAVQFLGIGSGETPRESLAHAYWKRVYARRFSEQGYDVQLEAQRHGGRVDVLAHKGDERIGIEVETGKSDVVENVRNCLRSGLQKVLVVATDEAAMEKIERHLAKAGLLIPGRVELVLRDELREAV